MIYTHCGDVLAAARARFLSAYEALKNAGLHVDIDRVYSKQEVEINLNYEAALYAFGVAIMSERKARDQWVECMNGDHGNERQYANN